MIDNNKFKKLLITGANSSIGYAACKKYLKSGYEITALYNNSSNYVDKLIVEHGCKIKAHSINLNDAHQLSEFIKNNQDCLSNISVFVHLAAIHKEIEYENLTAYDLIEHFTVNMVSLFILTQFFSKTMSKNLYGRIVVASSIGVKYGGGSISYAYSLSKHASEFFPNMHRKWSQNNVLINAIRIGATNTDHIKSLGDKKNKHRVSMIPMRRFAEPSEIANEIYHLGSINNTFTTGQVVTVAGGE
jgi:NAD(P)-dependent dehydrogenase (short-subunit alcohol dehydrogenase family)